MWSSLRSQCCSLRGWRWRPNPNPNPNPTSFPHPPPALWRIFAASIASRSKKRRDELWVKEKDLDTVIQTERKTKEVLQIMHLLEQQEEHILSLYDLKNFWRCVGSKGMRRFRFLVKKYPGIFRYTVDHEKEPWVELTEGAEELLVEEKRAKQENVPLLVDKMRKLLMMSVDKKLRVEKLCHWKYMYGFPDEFRKGFFNDYPEYFQVVESSVGPCLELRAWDPQLAVTAREMSLRPKVSQCKPQLATRSFQHLDQRNIYAFEMLHPKGGTPGRRHLERIAKFQELPFSSPYEDAVELDLASPQAEKRTVGVVHELLSLTIDKKSVVSRISFFKNEFGITNISEGFLERYPGIFYVSHKGDHHVVFLKEGYKGSEVIDKNPFVLLNERLIKLMRISPRHKRAQTSDNEDEESLISSSEHSEVELLENSDRSLAITV